MSVLEEQQCGVNELLKCKLAYLQTQNTWMQKEYDYLCQLIDLQKQIIHSTSSTTIASLHTQIEQLLHQRNQYFQKLKAKEVNCRDLEIDQFIPLVYSFQEKIQALQREIKNRENSLQTIEVSKGCEDLQKKSEIKCINSYESHSRILERIKREISALKQRKCRLQNDLIALNNKSQQQSTIVSSKAGQSNKAVDQTLSQAEDQSSVFEKVIMLIKKKRYQNSCLQQKVSKYRQSVERKKAATLQLKKQIEGLQWNCLDGFVGACGFIDSGQVGDLSLLGKSFTNNASFSFDVSRFIKPSKRFRISQM